jgi:membrane protease YdiL (CAAX protease family)
MKQTLDFRRIGLFLFFAFGIAWAVALWLYLTGGLAGSPELIAGTGLTLAYVAVIFGYMFAPTYAQVLTRLITKEGWKDLHLGLNLAKGWKAWLAAWLGPIALILLGAALYFLVFPAQVDATLPVMGELITQMQAQGQGSAPAFSPSTLLLILLGVAVVAAPLINSIFTFGEEFGWRAYLQPKLMALGFRKAMVLMGVIWGVWHWPLIAMGHNYGVNYFGAPWTGMLAMVWFTFIIGTLFGWLVLHGGSVWPAVIGHSVVNAFTGFPIYFLASDAEPNLLLGPMVIGLIASIPWALVSLYLLWKGDPTKA